MKRISEDFITGCVYIQITDALVAHTVTVGGVVNVDVDEHNHAVGVEILDFVGVPKRVLPGDRVTLGDRVQEVGS